MTLSLVIRVRKLIESGSILGNYFSSLSVLRTALHYLNAWNRLNAERRMTLKFDEVRFRKLGESGSI